MSVKLECDRCGVQEQTSGVMLFAGLTGPSIPTARPELPDGWTRPKLPREDGSAWYTDLCPSCKAELLRFMAGHAIHYSVGVPQPEKPGSRTNARGNCFGCGHAPHTGQCRELTMPGAPGDVDECGCTEAVPDLGTGAPLDQICPGCGHLRHSTKCPDHVSEVGPCGCTNLTPRDRMKELGIDD